MSITSFPSSRLRIHYLSFLADETFCKQYLKMKLKNVNKTINKTKKLQHNTILLKVAPCSHTSFFVFFAHLKFFKQYIATKNNI